MDNVDFVIVGGGIGGSSLGYALAGSGADVVILERETEFRDRVRGEWMAPWGVDELKRLGLYDRFIAAGGRHIARAINYDERITPDQAEANAIPVSRLHPRIPGPLCMEHVVMQNEAIAAAQEAGATVLRGVAKVEATAGASPSVRFEHQGANRELGCRLVIGADGRTSTVRRQLGMALESYPMENLIAGLLIDGATEWPEDVQATGKAGDIHYLVFPQGNGRIRLYAEFSADQRGRFAGPEGAQDMLQAFDRAFIRNCATLANATPVGPCRAMPAQSSMIHTPYCEGAVLIGDAAGYNDPIVGQGLAITLRDARLIADTLRHASEITPALFEPYAEERRERMRRLKIAAEVITALNARFDAESVKRRERAFGVIGAEPQRLMGLLAAAYQGPETAPAEVFTDGYRESLFGAA